MAYVTLETAIANKLIAWLKEKEKEGAPLTWEHRSGSGGFGYKKGVPDFYVVVDGRHLEIELKAPNGRLSPMQEKFKWRCETQWNIPYLSPRSAEEAIAFVESFLPK